MTYINLYEGSSVQDSIQFYTGRGYELINPLMRGEDICFDVEREYYDQIEMLDEDEKEEAINEAIENLEIEISRIYQEFEKANNEMIVYRGINTDEIKKDKSFISTSLSLEEAKKHGKTIVKYTVKKGQEIIDTRERTWTEGEEEIILSPIIDYKIEIL